MQISIFNGAGGVAMTRHDVQWADVVATCQNPPSYPSKAECPLIKMARFGDLRTEKHSLRHGANCLSVTGVELDYDAELISPSIAAGLLQIHGIETIVYTSPSHTTVAPRWRVLAPLSAECEPSIRRDMVARINGALGGVCADESYVLAQAFYIGRVNGAEYECHVSRGACVDTIAGLPTVYPDRKPTVMSDDVPFAEYTPHPEREGIARERIERMMTNAAEGERHYARLRAAKLAGGFVAGGVLEHDATVELLREVSDRIGGGDTPHTEWQTILDGLRVGMQSPVAPPGCVADVFGQVNLPVPVPTAPRQTVIEGEVILGQQSQLELFAGCVYVRGRNVVLTPGGHLMKQEQFRVTFGGRMFVMDNANGGLSKNAWEAYTDSKILRPLMADSTCFRPDLPPAYIEDSAGRLLANTYWPAKIRRVKGDATPFLNHLRLVLPVQRDRDILLAYMAACVQHMGVKFPWCPVLQGCEGNGKTLFSMCVAEAVGQHYTHWPHADDLASPFNGWVADKVLICLEELHSQDHQAEVLEKLKTLVTGGMGIQVQFKGVDQESRSICANFMATTNYQTAIRKTHDNARRFGMFFCAQQSRADIIRDGMDGDYFPNLYRWLRADGFAVVAELLYTHQIPAEFNPAGAMHRAPDTSTTETAIAESMGGVEQHIAEAIAQDTPGFMGGWVSGVMLDRLITETLRLGNKISHNKRREMLKNMGYVQHPGLHEGRVNNPVAPDMRKGQLFVKVGSAAQGLVGATVIAKAYSAAQSA